MSLPKYSVTSLNQKPLGPKECMSFKEASRLGRFYMYSKYREQDLITRPV